MGTEGWVLKDTNLITNTKKQRLKILSRVWNFENTVLKERKKREKKTRSQKLFYIYAFWPSIYLLWTNAYLGFLSIF